MTIDHIPHLEMPARAAAEVSAQAGHDLFGFTGSGGPRLYIKHLLDLSPLVAEMEQKYGKVQPIGRQIAYDPDSNTWPAFPNYYISFPGLYRKDLWDEIGMVPDTWEDILKGGAKLKAKGNPIGIGLGHSGDPNNSWRGLMWSYGATEVDQSGKQVTINSKADPRGGEARSGDLQGGHGPGGAVLGRRRQQPLPRLRQGLLDPQPDLGLPHDPAVQPGARRSDLLVEDAGRTGAPARGRCTELVRHLEVRPQPGRRA